MAATFVIGFTGTQLGMTDAQKKTVRQLLRNVDSCSFHHGDCVGADAEAHEIATRLCYVVVLHPPKDPSKRAFCKAIRENEPFEYIDRNHRIVDDCDVLIAAPKGKEEVRSGTWATVRYARKRGRKIMIVMPDGKVLEEGKR